MSVPFKGWAEVSAYLQAQADDDSHFYLNESQRASLRAISGRLPQNGLLIADEVGMGKTRIAASIADVVIKAGGRVAVLVPPGIGFQWQKEFLTLGRADVGPVLRNYGSYLEAWTKDKAIPWFEQPIVLLSHAFANWRLGPNAYQRRWELLAVMRKIWSGQALHESTDPRISTAAKQICNYVDGQVRRPDPSDPDTLKASLCNHRPKRDYDDSDQYSVSKPMRPLFEKAIGLGLGLFDLVIIDEAHKARGVESGLERLTGLLWTSPQTRRIGLTATPIELDSGQWAQILTRIGVSEANLNAIQSYKDAVGALRPCWSTNEEAQQAYAKAAAAFQTALAPYVLRRDKRQDQTVRDFVKKTGRTHDAYRHLSEIRIEPENLPVAWRQAICATEALSFVVDGQSDPLSKRLRLTIGNGHGIASLLDELTRDGDSDSAQLKADEENNAKNPDLKPIADSADKVWTGKRAARVQWWQSALKDALATANARGLFDHPSILAAVKVIEEAVFQDEKVLVFGRYTRPMRALVNLLDARAMLRALDDGTPWPQSKIPSCHDSEGRHDPEGGYAALQAAWRQLNPHEQLDRASLEDALAKQFHKYEAARERLRAHIFDWIAKGLSGRDHTARALLDKVRKMLIDESAAPFVRAISELMEQPDDPDPEQCAQSFRELISTFQSDKDIDDEESAAVAENIEESEGLRWKELHDLLKEEYSPVRSGFARLMYGKTPPKTRRLLQGAFNRRQSFPKVLVAQSVVGREGLNLHEACRIVVLLHPEWNPGVVEQQIGRVDRLGSRWAKEMKAYAGAPDAAPRIKVRPVVFSGTYDEHNWQVLLERWDDLRAQLHGVVVPSRYREKASAEDLKIIQKLDDDAPDFSPERDRYGVPGR